MKARDVMTSGATYCASDATAKSAAQMMAEENLGAIPVCGPDGRLMGMITDRDLALRVVAENRMPEEVVLQDIVTTGEVVTIGADDSIEEAMRTMKEHAVRRLPVIDGQELVGMVSQADIAMQLPESEAGEVVAAISDAAANN